MNRIRVVEWDTPTDIHEARGQYRDVEARIEAIRHEARVANRPLTTSEEQMIAADEARLEGLAAYIESEQERREQSHDRSSLFPAQSDPRNAPRIHSQPRNRPGLAEAVFAAGWDLRQKPNVTVSMRQAFGLPEEWNPEVERLTDGTLLGRDERFLWRALPGRNAFDSNGDVTTSIQDWRQTVRTVTGEIEIEMGSTEEKATLDLGIEPVTAKLKVLALILEDIPQALFDSLPGVRSWFDSEALYQLNMALDRHVLAQITAANVPSGTTGDDIIAQIRYGISAMRLVGTEPSILALGPTNAAALDLHEAGDGNYLFAIRSTGDSSPIWNLRVVEVTPQGGTEIDPMLIDPGRLGMVYTSNLAVLANPYTKMSTNQVDIRFEQYALAHIRNPAAAYRIGPPIEPEP